MELVELPPVFTSVDANAVVTSIVNRSVNGSENTIGSAVWVTVILPAPVPML